ncbi:MAG: rhodanese-like domain-containing protein [Cellulosilyticaceae bacterium]
MFGQDVTAQEAKEIITEQKGILLDIRSKEEYEEKHIEGCMLIPVAALAFEVEEHIEDYDTPIVLYCRSGRRTKIAAIILNDLGYNNIYDLGSIDNWFN